MMKKQCLYVAVVLLVAGVLALAAGGDEQKPQKPQTPTGFHVTAESR
jgi:hypothetical protein